MRQLRLYAEPFWVSPYVFSVFVGLREKRLDCEIVPLALHEGAQFSPAYRDRSLTAKVPMLEHGEFALSESSAIIEYLEEVFPPPQYAPLLPADVHARARARQLMAWIRSELLPLREQRPTNSMFYPRPLPQLTPEAQAAADTLVRVVAALLTPPATSLFGDWCIADSELSFALHRLILNGHALPPALQRFAAVQWQRPSVQAFVKHDRLPTGPPDQPGAAVPAITPAATPSTMR